MKMRNRIRTILAILLAAVFLLTGCRIFKKDVHTVLTLTNAALTNVAEARGERDVIEPYTIEEGV
jgi:hypothetical protein